MYFQPIQFGERIRKLRREHHLTQERLAVMLNVSVEHLRKIELGKRGISIIEQADTAIAEWDEYQIRALVESVRILSKDEVLVRLKSGIEKIEKLQK